MISFWITITTLRNPFEGQGVFFKRKTINRMQKLLLIELVIVISII